METPCPICQGIGVHNDGESYLMCWNCVGYGWVTSENSNILLGEHD